MKKIFLLLALLFTATAYAHNTDSLISLVFKEKTDTARIRRYYDLMKQLRGMDPVKAIEVQQKVLSLSKKQKNRKLEAVTTSELGWLFYISGSTVPGTHALLEAIKIAESTEDPQTLGISYNNLAATTADDKKKKELSEKALAYSTQADDYYFMCIEMGNLANVYLRTQCKNMDSALSYAEKCCQLALAKKQEDVLVFNLLTLARVHRESGNKGLDLEYIRMAERLPVVKESRNLAASVYTAYARHYDNAGQKDSALFYAYKSLNCSQGSFLTMLSNPVNALRQLYRGINSDSALKYSDWYYSIRDSLQKTEAVQQSLAMRFEEDLREEKLEEERHRNLQYAGIAIGVVLLSILFLIFSHSTIATPRLIKFLGIVSLLIVFEFTNLLIHPYIGSLTHESPVMMLGFMVCLAALLVPLHHKIEHWLTHKMIEKNNRIRLKKARRIVEHLEKKRCAIDERIGRSCNFSFDI